MTMFKSTFVDGELITKDLLKSILRKQTVAVTFIKKDGTERLMKCTLSEDLIPEVAKPKAVANGTSTIVRSDESLAVYDVVASGWRSFRYDSINSINFDLE